MEDVHDEASNDWCSGTRVISVTLEECSNCYALKLDFTTTNNETEYEALIVGFKLARELGVKALQIFYDFQLVVNQD